MDSPFHSTHTLCEHVDERVDASSISAPVGTARSAQGFWARCLFSVWVRQGRDHLAGGGGCLALISMHRLHLPDGFIRFAHENSERRHKDRRFLVFTPPSPPLHPSSSISSPHVTAGANHVRLFSICDGTSFKRKLNK